MMRDCEDKREYRTEQQIDLAIKKRDLLDLAKEIKNVSEACRRLGYSRQQFYVIRHHFEQYGFEGLFNRQPGAKNRHPNRVDISIEEMILDLVIIDPSRGSKALAYQISLNGKNVSPTGVRGVLERHELQTVAKRTKYLLDCVLNEKISISDQQIHAIEKHFPSFQDRHLKVTHPGNLVAIGAIRFTSLTAFDKLYLHSAIDCYTRLSICKFTLLLSPSTTAQFLTDTAIPYFRMRDIDINQVLTSQSEEYRGSECAHNFENILEIAQIDHIYTSDRSFTGSGYTKELIDNLLNRGLVEFLSDSSNLNTLGKLNHELEVFIERYNKQLIGGMQPFQY